MDRTRIIVVGPSMSYRWDGLEVEHITIDVPMAWGPEPPADEPALRNRHERRRQAAIDRRIQ